jgi:hypothetical protein
VSTALLTNPIVADIQPYLDVGLGPHLSGTLLTPTRDTHRKTKAGSDDIATAAGMGVIQKEAGMSASRFEVEVCQYFREAIETPFVLLACVTACKHDVWSRNRCDTAAPNSRGSEWILPPATSESRASGWFCKVRMSRPLYNDYSPYVGHAGGKKDDQSTSDTSCQMTVHRIHHRPNVPRHVRCFADPLDGEVH